MDQDIGCVCVYHTQWNINYSSIIISYRKKKDACHLKQQWMDLECIISKMSDKNKHYNITYVESKKQIK